MNELYIPATPHAGGKGAIHEADEEAMSLRRLPRFPPSLQRGQEEGLWTPNITSNPWDTLESPGKKVILTHCYACMQENHAKYWKNRAILSMCYPEN